MLQERMVSIGLIHGCTLKKVCGLSSLVPGRETLNPRNFPSDRSSLLPMVVFFHHT